MNIFCLGILFFLTPIVATVDLASDPSNGWKDWCLNACGHGENLQLTAVECHRDCNRWLDPKVEGAWFQQVTTTPPTPPTTTSTTARPHIARPAHHHRHGHHHKHHHTKPPEQIIGQEQSDDPDAKLGTNATAMTFAIDWTSLLGDPQSWSVAFKAAFQHAAIGSFALAFLGAPMTWVGVSFLFLLGSSASIQTIIVLVGSYYFWRSGKKWIAGLGLYWIWATFKGFDPMKVF